ncbi:hypothetical protein, partial [Prochlorothrix hollandica]|uniref:hypothetical protein n=1 Tax=Prochlorothrix hollandica TaxID=1223 RepID=UPI003340D7A0
FDALRDRATHPTVVYCHTTLFASNQVVRYAMLTHPTRSAIAGYSVENETLAIAAAFAYCQVSYWA